MPDIVFQGNKFWWMGDSEVKILLDCSSCLDNKSSVSIHRWPGQDFPVIPELILHIHQETVQEGREKSFFGILAATLLVRRLMRTSQPVRVLEYGCSDGWLSAILAELLGRFHDQSILVCASDALDENTPDWLGRMERTAPVPRLAYLAGDYGNLELPAQAYDCVFVNSASSDPAGVLRDSQRLLHADGEMFCLVQDAPLLEETFKLYYEKWERYADTPARSLLTAKAADYCGPASDDDTAWEHEARLALDEARTLIKDSGASRDALLQMEETLKHYLDLAVKRGHVTLKIELLDVKESVVNSLI